MQSRHEIEHLLYRYAEAIDFGRFDEIAELFAHGTYGADGQEDTWQGAEVADGIGGFVRLYDGIPRTQHVMTNVIIDVADDDRTATARSRYTVLQQVEGGPLQIIIAGHYSDRFHRVGGDGEWAFAERIVFMDLVGDLSGHLGLDIPS